MYRFLLIFSIFFVICPFAYGKSEEMEPKESNWQKIKSGVKGLFRDFYTEHFVKKYRKVEDLYAHSKQDLYQKVDDTKKYLGAIKRKEQEILDQVRNDTNEKVHKALGKLQEWHNEVAQFEKKVYNSTIGELEQLSHQWKESITNKWNNGLESIIEITRKAEIGKNVKNQPDLEARIETADAQISRNLTNNNVS